MESIGAALGSKIPSGILQNNISWLESNSTLQILNLSGNTIGADGAASIGAALQVNSTLLSLSLSENKLGELGAQHLAEAIRINETLRNLLLINIDQGLQGTVLLRDALTLNSSLSHLGLTGLYLYQEIDLLTKRNHHNFELKDTSLFYMLSQWLQFQP